MWVFSVGSEAGKKQTANLPLGINYIPNRRLNQTWIVVGFMTWPLGSSSCSLRQSSTTKCRLIRWIPDMCGSMFETSRPALAPTASYPLSTVGSFLEGKATGAWSFHHVVKLRMSGSTCPLFHSPSCLAQGRLAISYRTCNKLDQAFKNFRIYTAGRFRIFHLYIWELIRAGLSRQHKIQQF